MKLKPFIIILIIFILIFIFLVYSSSSNHPNISNNARITDNSIRFIPIGDSYTIGMGVKQSDRWPNRLIRNLKSQDINIELVANPAVSGFTVKQAINYELPMVTTLKPDLVSVFIGANDSFMLTDPVLFEQDYRQLLSKLEATIDNPKNIILISLPDYSKAPASRRYPNNFRYHQIVISYNQIIKNISQEKKLPLVDLYPISQTMTESADYILDGLHPSALGYQKWETVIFPVFLEVTKAMD